MEDIRFDVLKGHLFATAVDNLACFETATNRTELYCAALGYARDMGLTQGDALRATDYVFDHLAKYSPEYVEV